MNQQNQAQEYNLGLLSTDSHQFSSRCIQKFFKNLGQCDGPFDFFSSGLDPNAKGHSDMGVSFLGVKNGIIYLLYANALQPREEDKIHEIFFNEKKYFIDKALEKGWMNFNGSNDNQQNHGRINSQDQEDEEDEDEEDDDEDEDYNYNHYRYKGPKLPKFQHRIYKSKFFDWIENFGNHGYAIQQEYFRYQDYARFNKVMKAMDFDYKTNKFKKFTIAKTKTLTDQYVYWTVRLILSNRFKIHEKFFSRNMNGDQIKLLIRKQMRNLIRDPKTGKIAIKDKKNGKNDDVIISIIMQIYNILRSLNPREFERDIAQEKWLLQNEDLHRQLYDWTGEISIF